MDLRCPKCGQASTDAEFCSECGASMAVPAPAAPAAAPRPPDAPGGALTGGVEACPVCGELRPGPLARFCDTCRYDFVTRLPFSAAASTTPAASLVASAGPAAPPAPPLPVPAEAAPSPAVQRWELLAQVDASLRKPEDPEPGDRSERLFPLDLQDHLIGRRSDSADIHPEVVVPDPGISRRHARLLRQPGGGMALVDLGSMNGTQVNGAAVAPNVITPLAEGDQVTLGCWTRLTLRGR